MRLSEAIMLGAPELRHFSNGCWFRRNSDGSCDGCLVGAALCAIGHQEEGESSETLANRWPWLRLALFVCPGCRLRWGFRSGLTCMMSHYLKGELTLPQIADYIRSIEPAETDEPVQQAAEISGAKEMMHGHA
jgi:hypothetical protein